MARLYKRGKIYYSDLFVDGHRVREPLSSDRRIAEGMLSERIQARNSGKYGHAQKKMTWVEFRTQHSNESKTDKKPATQETEKSVLDNIERTINPTHLADLNPESLSTLKAEWIGRKLSPHTVNRYIRCVKSLMRHAEASNKVFPVSWKHIKQVNQPKGKLRFLSHDELRFLSQELTGTYRTMVYLGSRAGLRRGEMLALEWTDIDFERGRINIAPKPGWNPKDYERRHIPMTKDLREYLSGLRLTTTKPWILKGPSFDYHYSNLISCQFRRAVKHTGVSWWRGVTIHTLRHTFGSHLAMAGVPIYTISKLMGHSNLTTTEIYAHLAPETYETAINALPDL